ncbi:hypothetical protein MXD62_22990 [Frankia sp. Mgl5]|uniref:hypothetical protein n=1 Tax=Frankia sp. Mgl5 TaxID=2933793 RepID=UPI002010B1FD|nr:hypothetical protein [Frankia sp. Mgl5]MCK9929996.1 hypothetical protein [Frankia sp. Mgl5]
MTKAELAALEIECLKRDVAAFYASGGWTKERRERFAPIWAETCRLKALREQEPAAQVAVPVEPLTEQADAA